MTFAYDSYLLFNCSALQLVNLQLKYVAINEIVIREWLLYLDLLIKLVPKKKTLFKIILHWAIVYSNI